MIDITPIIDSLPPDFRSVVYMNPSTHGELRGFTITGGTGTSETALNARVAGGIYVKNSLHDVLNRLIITGDKIEVSVDYDGVDSTVMGGGVFSYNVNNLKMIMTTVEQCSLEVWAEFHTAYAYGGGVAALSTDTIAIDSSSFIGDVCKSHDNMQSNFYSTVYGGGVYVNDADSTVISRSIFDSNILSPGSIEMDVVEGAALYFNDGDLHMQSNLLKYNNGSAAFTESSLFFPVKT